MDSRLRIDVGDYMKVYSVFTGFDVYWDSRPFRSMYNWKLGEDGQVTSFSELGSYNISGVLCIL